MLRVSRAHFCCRARFEANSNRIGVAIEVALSNGITFLGNFAINQRILEIISRRIFGGLPCCLRRRAEKEEESGSCCDVSVWGEKYVEIINYF